MELCKWTIDLSALPSFQQNASTPTSSGFYTGASFGLPSLASGAGALGREGPGGRQRDPGGGEARVGAGTSGVLALDPSPLSLSLSAASSVLVSLVRRLPRLLVN